MVAGIVLAVLVTVIVGAAALLVVGWDADTEEGES